MRVRTQRPRDHGAEVGEAGDPGAQVRVADPDLEGVRPCGCLEVTASASGTSSSRRLGHNVVMDQSRRRSSAIARSDDVQGGTPVFAGTRVPVGILFDHLEEGESLESFLQQHPSVTREQALEVLEAAKVRVTQT